MNMQSLSDQLYIWLKNREDSHLEFKEAKNTYSTDKVIQYCAAFANEGGGRLILGITDEFPRKIVGTCAFENLEKIKSDLISRLRIRVEVQEIYEDRKRVLVFSVPSRPIGVPIQYDGKYWMRSGEELVTMTVDMLQRIFAEAVPDFSAQICPEASFEDLDLSAVKNFRDAWIRKSGNQTLNNISDEQLLLDIEVLTSKGVTFAALILFGTRKALGRHLAQSEIIFEYRSNEITGSAQQRLEYRQGFFAVYNELWEKINLRNDNQHFQDGMFIFDVPTFNEKAVRETILNAVSHRDYQAAGSIWILQYPRKITIASPGGFPPGINPANILWKQQPRNRRIAEVFSKCGLVERAGQGADRIYEESIKQSKALPDFSRTDEHEVVLTLDGQVQDESFLRFFAQIGQKQVASFSVLDFLVLDCVHKERPISPDPADLRRRLKYLVDLGIVEVIGRGKNAQYMLCQKYYVQAGKSGVYTRRRGLARETNKELLLKHLLFNADHGSRLMDLCQVLPSLSTREIQVLLKELRVKELAYFKGKTKASLWFPITN